MERLDGMAYERRSTAPPVKVLTLRIGQKNGQQVNCASCHECNG